MYLFSLRATISNKIIVIVIVVLKCAKFGVEFSRWGLDFCRKVQDAPTSVGRLGFSPTELHLQLHNVTVTTGYHIVLVKKVKFTVLHLESVGGCSSPYPRPRARRCMENH